MLKRIISGILVIIVLVGAIGVSYDSHYCSGRLIKSELSLFPSNLTCGMKVEKTLGNDSDGDAISRVCCSNEHIDIDLGDDLVKYQLASLIIINNFTIPEAIINNYAFSQELEYVFLGYTPPPDQHDLIVLNQSFLI
jgi:hypothetical protein